MRIFHSFVFFLKNDDFIKNLKNKIQCYFPKNTELDIKKQIKIILFDKKIVDIRIRVRDSSAHRLKNPLNFARFERSTKDIFSNLYEFQTLTIAKNVKNCS